MGVLKEKSKDPLPEPVKDMIQLFSAMTDALRKVEGMPAGGARKNEEVRFHRLEVKVDALWLNLTRDEQVLAVRHLVASGHMRQEVADVLTVFEATVDPRTPPEPTLRIA